MPRLLSAPIRASFAGGTRKTVILAMIVCAVLSACATGPDWLSGTEIRAALADHTATLPGGFIEYYAPDGGVHGWSDGQPYQGTWTIEQDMFCTALGGDPPICSRVTRRGSGLMWSVDGEKRPSRVDSIVAGNPRGL